MQGLIAQGKDPNRRGKQKEIPTKHCTYSEIALADDETKMQGLAGFSNLISDYDDCEKEIIQYK